jgi:hypothetical protein
MTGGAQDSSSAANLVEEGFFAVHSFHVHRIAQQRTHLLRQHLDVRGKLIDECRGDLNRHRSLLRVGFQFSAPWLS